MNSKTFEKICQQISPQNFKDTYIVNWQHDIEYDKRGVISIRYRRDVKHLRVNYNQHTTFMISVTTLIAELILI